MENIIEHGERSIEKSFHRTEIVRIDITSVSGKAKRQKPDHPQTNI